MNGQENENDSSNDNFDVNYGSITVEKHVNLNGNTFVYVLPGIPIPLARARSAGDHMYDSQKHKKVVTGISLSALHGKRPQYSGPLHLDIKFYFPVPKCGARSKTVKPNMYHIIKPDNSNCIKYIEDVCSKLLYYDDCLIASIYSQKLYDYCPRTEFFLVELPTIKR